MSRAPRSSRQDYNVIAIGAGAGGLVASGAIAALGGRAALVERNKMGGDCLNFGCVPSKALISSARLAQRLREAGRWGLEAPEPRPDLQRVLVSMRSRRAAIEPNDSQERFEKMGVDVYRGEARFRSSHEIEVNGEVLRARHVVISTGTRAVMPPIDGLAEVRCFTNETIFDKLDFTPRSLLVVGGGPIGCELGQVFQRLGVQVTICQSGKQLLPREDPDVAALLCECLVTEGIRVHMSQEVARVVPQSGDSFQASLQPSKGSSGEPAQTVEAGALLVAAGREPALEALNLGAAGVRFNDRGIIVNEYMQTSQPHIFAAGDVAGGLQFTHLSDYHARVIVENIVRRAVPPLRWINWLARADLRVLPWCTYTSPEVARVGLSESEARKQNLDHRVFKIELRDVDRCILEREVTGFLKVVASPKGQILGATIIGQEAGELIHEIAVAMKHDISLGQLGSTIHAYPTRAEAVRKAGDAFKKTQLTPGKKRLLERLFQRDRS
ncbi:MAG: dihydrolipoyl dehydrogenase family protein [Opitutaceae bacterium]